MFGDLEGNKPQDAFKVLEELELNQPKSVQEVRQADEIELKSKVWVESGNASARAGKTEGMSSRLGKHAMTCVLPEPLMVGDVYRVNFDNKDLQVGFAYALCRRVRMINEVAFESSLDFFKPIDLTLVNDD